MPTKRGGGWLEEGANGRRAQYRREVSWSCCHHMARARQIKMKFAALTLHLEGMDEIQRAAQSSEHADSMVALIGIAALNGMEKDDVLNSILVAPNRNAWVASDLSRLVAAVEAHRPKRRRDSQVYLLPSEWDKWKANGVQGQPRVVQIKAELHIMLTDGEGLQYALEWNGPNALRPTFNLANVCACMAQGTLIYRYRIGCNSDSVAQATRQLNEQSEQMSALDAR